MTYDFSHIPSLDENSGLANVIIDTPKGSRNKFKFDEAKKLFKLKHVLPDGMVFPFDFGFIPNTVTEDGDPMDVLVLLSAPAFAGCLVETRIIGVLEAEQTSADGKTERNDRLIGVFAEAQELADLQELRELPGVLLSQIEDFFRNYNKARHVDFRILHRSGAKKAQVIIRKAIKAAQ